MPISPAKLSAKRKEIVVAGLEHEKQLRHLLKQGFERTRICQEMGITFNRYDHLHRRLAKRENGALNRLATIDANDSRRMLLDMAETAHEKREQGDGYRWIKSGVDALDVMGKQIGLGVKDSGVYIVVQIAVPVLVQAGKAGEVVGGERLLVSEIGDTPGGSLKGE